jgi:putative transposase
MNRIIIKQRLARTNAAKFIELGTSWENGYIESFKGQLKDELLNMGIFDRLWGTKILTERWRRKYNQVR